MVTVLEIIRKSEKILKDAGIESYRFDSQCIAEDVLRMNHSEIIMSYNKCISEENQNKITEMSEKRAEKYPLQYILGRWEFYGLPFIVGEGVLIPRADTEILADIVIEYCKGKKNPKILDLCSGTGCLAISAEKNIPYSQVYAVEFSDTAFSYLEKNIKLNNSAVKAVKADVLLPQTAERFINFDVIMSNPPYLTENDMKNLQKEVSFEPKYALYGKSTDGLHYYREISSLWHNSLKKGGIMAFETGNKQAEEVSVIMRINKFKNINIMYDLAGNPRVVYSKKIQEE